MRPMRVLLVPEKYTIAVPALGGESPLITGVYRIHASGSGGGGGGGNAFGLAGQAGGRATYSAQTRFLRFDYVSSGTVAPSLGQGGAINTDGTAGNSAFINQIGGGSIISAAGGALGEADMGNPIPLSSIFPYETSNEIGRGGQGGDKTPQGPGQNGKSGAIWTVRLA